MLILILPLFFITCQSGQDANGVKKFEITDTPVHDESISLPQEVLGDIIYTFSGIVEIPSLIKDLGLPYINGLPVPTGNILNYNTSIKRAFIMGVLGTGLGYMTIYNRTASASGYVAALRELTESLVVEKLFDFNNIERLAGSQTDPASLMYNFMHSYNRSDEYFRENKMAHLSTAMVSGVWLEGLYLLTRAADINHDSELFESIGEQKIILNDLIIILRNYEQSYPELTSLIQKLTILKEQFDKVEIVYEVDEPQAVEQDGMLVIVQNQRSTVNIADEQIRNITNEAEIIRNQLIL